MCPTSEIVGEWKDSIQLSQHYFAERGCWVDCRGDVRVSPTSAFGYGVKIISMSHSIDDGIFGVAVSRRVWIDDGAWIASFAILSSCWIQSHSIVSAGSVVNGVIVPPYSIVAGNPAMLVARFLCGKWVRLEKPEPLQPWEGRRA